MKKPPSLDYMTICTEQLKKVTHANHVSVLNHVTYQSIIKALAENDKEVSHMQNSLLFSKIDH